MEIHSWQSHNRTPRLVVAIMGARMHYAVAVAMQQAGGLATLFTDFYLKGDKFGNLVGKILHRSGIPFLQRAAGRHDGRIPGDKITSYPWLGLRFTLALKFSRSRGQIEANHLHFATLFGKAVSRSDWKQADAVYAVSLAAREIFIAARGRGVGCILEQISLPVNFVHAVYRQEAKTWSGWQNIAATPVNALSAREAEEWSLADGILCPSRVVIDHLAACGVPEIKCWLTPYAVDVEFFAPNEARDYGNKRLKVLYLGRVDLLKGVQYLYQALELLDAERFSVIAAGGIKLNPEAVKVIRQSMRLPGQITRQEVVNLYHWADVLVLPSLCEGSAMVTYEALACGLPVIATVNAGSCVQDGVTGNILPVRDPQAIADALQHLADHPDLRREMSMHARGYAVSQLSWEAYGRRLLGAIEDVLGSARAL